MRKGLNVGLACLAIFVAAATVAACGSDDEGGSSGSSASSSGGGGADKKAADSPKKILFISLTLGGPGQIQIRRGLEAEAEKFGDTVDSLDANADVAKANSLMSTGVRQGYDAIVLDSFPPSALQAGLNATRAAKIPVYEAAAFTKAPPGISMTIAMRGGVPQTERMVEVMGEEADVLAFTYDAGDSCKDTGKGLDEVASQYPGLKITKHPVKIPGWEADAAAATRAWLQSHPEGSGKLAIWGCWDGPNIGAVSALHQEDRTDVKVFGKDGTAQALKLLQKKDPVYDSTVWFNLMDQGVQIVQQVHKDYELGYENIKPQAIDQDYTIVDKTNIDAFAKEHPEALQG